MTTLMKLSEVPLAHQLPYWWIGDSACVMHDGTLALAWKVTGIDISTLSDEAVNGSTHHLRNALNALPVGATVQFLRHVQVVPPSNWDAYLKQIHTQNPILRELRAKTAKHLRALQFRTADTYAVISKPKALGELGARNAKGFDRLVNAVLGLADPAKLTREHHLRVLEELQQGAGPFLRALVATGATIQRLDDDGFARLIYTFLNPTRAAVGESPIIVDEPPPDRLSEADGKLYRSLSLREQLVTTGLSWSADTLFLDDPIRPHRVVGLKALPPSTTASLIRQANTIAFPHWLSIGISVPDSEARFTSIEKRRNRAKVQASGFAKDVRADIQASELEAAMNAMIARDQRVFSVTAHLLIEGEDLLELDRRTNSVVDTFRAVHMPFVTEQQAQLFAWRGMLPGNAHQAVHTRTCLTDNAADLLPVYESWSGDRRPLFVLSHRTGEAFNFDLADPKRVNWNSLVFGGSGGGKTFVVLSLLNSSMLSQGSDVIVIDVGGGEVGSYYRLCKMMGGDFIDLNLDGTNAVNPFADRETLFLDNNGNPSKEPNQLRIQYLMNITSQLVRNTAGEQIGRIGEAILRKAILTTYDRVRGRTPIYNDLVESLEAVAGDTEDKEVSRRMAKVLRATLSGAIGKLINQPTRVAAKSSFIVFDMKGLENLGELASVMLLVVSSYIWNMVGRKRNKLAWLIYDECWAMMRYEAAAEVQSELYRTARKLNVGVISITQKLEDFLVLPSSKAIVSNTTTTFLLKHKEDDVPKVAEILALNVREQQLLSSLKREKGKFSELFVKQEAGSALLRYAPSAWEYWLNTTDPGDRLLENQVLAQCEGDRLKTLRQLVDQYPNGAAAGAKKESKNA